MGKYFGTDGIRGRANEKLTGKFAYKLGLAFASNLPTPANGVKPLLVIGKDTRISGSVLEAALAAGCASKGCDVLLLGVIPTPGVAAMIGLKKADAGAVISASHNPFYDNGIKFFDGLGNKLSDEMEAAVEETLDDAGVMQTSSEDGFGQICYCQGAADEYRNWLNQHLSPNLSGLTIACDAANGAASGIASELFKSLGAKVLMLGNAPDGLNINRGCGSTHMDTLCETVLREKADIGIAFDGDADRMLAVDEMGNIVDGDQIIAIIASDMKAKGELSANIAVITQMSNLGFRQAMEAIGAQVEETKVGDRYVLERMIETGAAIGGEQSGHIILRQYNTTGDGPLAALKLLSVVVERKKSLSKLARVMKRFPQVLINVQVKNKDGLQTDADIFKMKQEAEVALGTSGRVLLRPSGTEQIIRVMAEGENEEELNKIAEGLAALIKNKLG